MEIGTKIKAYRLREGLTIPQLSETTGLSRGFISQLENGKASLSIDSLGKIASALNVPVKDFLEEKGFSPEVVRRDARPAIKIGTSPEMQILSSAFGRSLQVLMIELPAGYQCGENDHSHEGEEFIMVLSGRITAKQGSFEAELNTGDSIHIDSASPHICINSGEDTAKLIIALTPPALLPISRSEDSTAE